MRLRIIAGNLGGRFIDSPDTATTHPMSERMRGALFNILGDITGKVVLDPFAGSGALGLEALSRGAASALFLERDAKAQKTIIQLSATRIFTLQSFFDRSHPFRGAGVFSYFHHISTP